MPLSPILGVTYANCARFLSSALAEWTLASSAASALLFFFFGIPIVTCYAIFLEVFFVRVRSLLTSKKISTPVHNILGLTLE